ncbi:DivIVA domain-containing protein [Kribbella sp. NPDC059898]|uniref:DivIVA domain-containing protein n=1 Tax=Kribbella sp. NPDC059898 TaxID=3346995 RepID=UPI00364B1E8E
MWFFGLIVVLLIGAVAVVASGRWGAMSTAYDDRPDMTVPARQALTSTDIESARFAVGVRGYRMDEVDTLLERVAKEVAERDRRIADLERAVAPIVESPEGHGFTSNPYRTPEFDDTGTQKPILVGGDFPDQAADPTVPLAAADATSTAGEPDEPTAAAATGTPDDNTTGTASAGTPEGTAAGASAGGETAAPAEVAADTSDPAADDEPETRELPRASQVAADEYERLQAEARAVLEAQSQPVTPRRTPAPQPPPYQPSPDAYHQAAQKPSQAPLTPAQQYDQLKLSQPTASDGNASATHWTAQPAPQTEQQPQQQAGPAQDAQQADAEEQQSANGPAGDAQPGSANGQAADGTAGSAGGEAVEGEEGWRFWPPSGQEGEGAYQRPS